MLTEFDKIDLYRHSLKSCPFCASNKTRITQALHSTYFRVCCDDCFSCSGTYKKVEEAVDAWNMRANVAK